MKNIIEIDHLQKSFGDVHAVNDLSFRVKEGELFAFLGINGAGKSTTINIMCGQLAKDSGSISICDTDMDKDSDSVKRALGVVFQGSVLDRDLSVYDNLESRAALRHTRCRLQGAFCRAFGNAGLCGFAKACRRQAFGRSAQTHRYSACASAQTENTHSR